MASTTPTDVTTTTSSSCHEAFSIPPHPSGHDLLQSLLFEMSPRCSAATWHHAFDLTNTFTDQPLWNELAPSSAVLGDNHAHNPFASLYHQSLDQNLEHVHEVSAFLGLLDQQQLFGGGGPNAPASQCHPPTDGCGGNGCEDSVLVSMTGGAGGSSSASYASEVVSWQLQEKTSEVNVVTGGHHPPSTCFAALDGACCAPADLLSRHPSLDLGRAGSASSMLRVEVEASTTPAACEPIQHAQGLHEGNINQGMHPGGAGGGGKAAPSTTVTRAKRAAMRQQPYASSPPPLVAGCDDEAWAAPLEELPTGKKRSSQFRGVTKHRRSGRWEAHIWIKEIGRQVYLGGYEVEEHAAEAYDVAALKCKGRKVKTNFGIDRYSDLLGCMDSISLEELIMAVRRQSQGFSRGSSSYRGVTAHPSGRWESRVGIPGSKHIYLGLFEDDREAARAYDRALVRLRGSGAATNFSLSDYRRELAEYHQMQQAVLMGDKRTEAIMHCGPEFEKWIKAGAQAFAFMAEALGSNGHADHPLGDGGDASCLPDELASSLSHSLTTGEAFSLSLQPYCGGAGGTAVLPASPGLVAGGGGMLSEDASRALFGTEPLQQPVFPGSGLSPKVEQHQAFGAYGSAGDLQSGFLGGGDYENSTFMGGGSLAVAFDQGLSNGCSVFGALGVPAGHEAAFMRRATSSAAVLADH